MDSQLFLPRQRQQRIMRPPVAHPSSQQTTHEQEAAAMQTTAILPEQSLSFVQIFLNAAVASVLYTRELLKHDSVVFSDRCIADLLGASGPVTYTDFSALDTQSVHSNSQAFKILVKGRSQKADRILTLLEGGIFNALQSGYLEAFQLSICTDSSRPSEVLECYTFTFTYTSSSVGSGRDVSSLTLSPGPHTLFFVGDAQKSFNAAIKGLLRLIRGLPQLPRHRNLGLNLFYTDDCPASYEPQGFTSCSDDSLYFPGGPGLARKSEKTSRLITGAHRTGVVISHVDSAEDQDQLQTIPEAVDYTTKCTRLDEYKVNVEAVSKHTEMPSQSFPPSAQPSGPTGIMPSPAAPSTQTRDDIQTRDALQQMQRSSSRPRELMPTQSLVSPDDIDSDDSDTPSQNYGHALSNAPQPTDLRERMIVPAKMAELIIHVTALQERGSINHRIFVEGALRNNKIERKKKPDVIKCECVGNFEENTMLLCEICGTWQHESCYGWDSIEKEYRPVVHVCYSCLLLPEEKDLNDWMPILVNCRNALRYLHKMKFPVETDDDGLIEAIRFNGDAKDLIRSRIIQTLLEQKLVEVRLNAIVYCNRPRGRVEYEDPLASIYHLYQLRNNDDPPSASQIKDALASLKLTYDGFALDAIRTHDSFGEDVIRYGWYPRLAARQSRKRSASLVTDSQDAASGAAAGVGEGPNKMPRTRKMSRSEMVCFDETSASETQSEVVMESEDEDDMYN